MPLWQHHVRLVTRQFARLSLAYCTAISIAANLAYQLPTILASGSIASAQPVAAMFTLKYHLRSVFSALHSLSDPAQAPELCYLPYSLEPQFRSRLELFRNLYAGAEISEGKQHGLLLLGVAVGGAA